MTEERPCWCIGCIYWLDCQGRDGDTDALFTVCSRWSPDEETRYMFMERTKE